MTSLPSLAPPPKGLPYPIALQAGDQASNTLPLGGPLDILTEAAYRLFRKAKTRVSAGCLELISLGLKEYGSEIADGKSSK